MFENIIEKMEQLKITSPCDSPYDIAKVWANEKIDKCIDILRMEAPIEIGDIIIDKFSSDKRLVIAINTKDGIVNCIDKNGGWWAINYADVIKTGDNIPIWKSILKKLV